MSEEYVDISASHGGYIDRNQNPKPFLISRFQRLVLSFNNIGPATKFRSNQSEQHPI